GSESTQFRDVQRALGLRGQSGSAVYNAFLHALEAAGLTLEDTYRNPSAAGVLYRAAEALVDISEQFWQLSAVHVQIAERTIGQRRYVGRGVSGGHAGRRQGVSRAVGGADATLSPVAQSSLPAVDDVRRQKHPQPGPRFVHLRLYAPNRFGSCELQQLRH